MACITGVGGSMVGYILKKKRRIGTIIAVIGLGVLCGFLLVGWASGQQQAPVPMTGDCMQAGCHDTVNNEATIHVAVNQEELQPGTPLNVAAGISMELDFYFENMDGSEGKPMIIGIFKPANPYKDVGMELIVDPRWDVSPGTRGSPQGWNAYWQQASNGLGALKRTSWKPTEDAAGHYYLDFGTSPWRASADLPALAADDGNESAADQDATKGKMGSDFILGVPADTPPGHYEVIIAGVGHDGKGRKSYVAQKIDVEVMSIGFVSTTSKALEGGWIYQSLCSSCHADTPAEKGKLLIRGTQRISWVIKWGTKDGKMDPIRGLTEEGGQALVAYIQQGAGPIPSAIPYIPHVAEGQVCKSCHASGGLRPAPLGHERYTDGQCLLCHRVLESVLTAGIPKVPHPTEGRTCLKCHGTDGIVPVRPSHEGRTGDVCRACHVTTKEMVGVVAPWAPHPTKVGTACSACHGSGQSIPMPQDHEGRKDTLCVACHDTDPKVIAAIPLMSHSPEGREACLACHSPAGWIPAPASHWSRTQGTCLLCHQGAGIQE